MSLRQKVKLEYELDGVEKDLVTEYTAVDLRAWEVAHHESSLSADLSIGMLTWLGHHSAVRRGELNGTLKTYKAFDEVCTSVEGVADEDDEARPTKRGKAATPRTATDESSAP